MGLVRRAKAHSNSISKYRETLISKSGRVWTSREWISTVIFRTCCMWHSLSMSKGVISCRRLAFQVSTISVNICTRFTHIYSIAPGCAPVEEKIKYSEINTHAVENVDSSQRTPSSLQLWKLNKVFLEKKNKKNMHPQSNVFIVSDMTSECKWIAALRRKKIAWQKLKPV